MLNVGQMRKHFFSNYLKDTGYDIVLGYRNKMIGGTEYSDRAIICGVLDSTKSYYLTAYVKKNSGDPYQKINIRLRYGENGVSNNEENEMYQNLKTINLSENDIGQEIKILFTPNANYNMITFELVRTENDFGSNSNNTTGRLVVLDDDKRKATLQEVNNVIQDLGEIYTNPKLTTLKQIGVRSEPGLMMCINGEEIIVGPSGVYEIYNGIQIKYLGFIIEDSIITSDKKTDFIVDFTY